MSGISNIDRNVGAWLAEGPERAPAHLLSATLAMTSGTTQRPGVVAVILGAPSASDNTARRIDPRVGWLVIALALAAFAATVAMIGVPRPALVVVPAPTAVPGPSVAPTRHPASPAPTLAETPAPESYSIPEWGITIKRDPTTPWLAIREGFDGHRIGYDEIGNGARYVLVSVPEHAAVDVFFDTCANGICPPKIITVSLARKGAGLLGGTKPCFAATPNVVFDCLASNDLWPITVDADTLKDLRRGWVETFGEATATRIQLDGEPAVMLERPTGRTVLAVHGGIRLAIIEQSGFGDGSEEAARAFDAVIQGFRFSGAAS